MDLFNDLQALTNKLNQGIKLLAKYGKEYAEKEKDYKIILRQETLKLRDDQNMKATIIPLIVYGIREVAEKRFERDVAEAMYNTAQENINAIKLQIRIIENQLQREWTNTK